MQTTPVNSELVPQPATVVAPIREILFPSDLSARSDHAFGQVRLLAERFHARLTLYHAIEVGRNAEGDPSVEARREKAGRYLHALGEPLGFEPDVLVERRTSTVWGLVAHIRETMPDLVVMATHGRQGLEKVLRGSITENVLRYGGRPVLSVQETDGRVTEPYRRILVPIDLSAPSRAAFPWVAAMAAAFGSEIVAVHVDLPPILATLCGIPDAAREEVVDAAEVRAFVHSGLPGLPFAVRTTVGSVSDSIVEMAGHERADLIVMATRGHDSLGDRILGSHTERVLRAAPCPLLAV